MNILITGGSGFIGKHIAEYISRKHHVFAPTHKQLDLLNENAVRAYFKHHPIDVIIHCALIGGYEYHTYLGEGFSNNLRIFFNIVRCRSYYKRLINIGSGAIYDKRFPIVKVKETDFGKSIPVDDYGLYKYICASYINTSDKMVDLRVFGVFGEGEDYKRRFISNAICRQIFGLPITIKQNVYFDYLDIIDFVKIVEYYLIHKPKYKAYNVGAGVKIDLITLAEKIYELSGDKKHPIVIEEKLLGREYTCNTNRLFKEFSGFTITPISDSLSRLFSWYRDQKADINKKHL